MAETVSIQNWPLGGPDLFLIAGPCVIENRDHCLFLAQKLKEIVRQEAIHFVFKASFDKANRTSFKSFRGPGLEKGLRILEEVKRDFEVPVLSDIHEAHQAKPASEVLDVIQIPAFLCRQTDLILSAASTGCVINVKKGQFLAPRDIEHVVEKIESVGNRKIVLTERGTSFGYNNLVVDFRSLLFMREFGYPVVFDATHSVQLPGGAGSTSSGQAECVPPLARAAVALGIDGIFMEVHQEPVHALSDGANALPLQQLSPLLKILKSLNQLVKGELASRVSFSERGQAD